MDMEQKRALGPWRRRMAAEAVLASVLTAGVAVLPLWLAWAVFCRIRGAGGWWYMPAAWALLAALLYGIRYRPTPRRVAARIDGLHSGDRAGSMLEFWDNPSLLCRLQREDALRHIRDLNPPALRFSLPALAACLALLAAIGGAYLLPEGAFPWLAAQPAVESEESLLLRQKVEQLRREVEASALDPDQKAQLLDALSLMEGQIQSGEMDISMLAEISRRMQSWSAGEDQRKPLSSYAQALLEQESLRPLGEAILAQDMAAVERALEQMGESLTALEGNQRVNALMGVVYDISATLQRGVQDEGQAKLTHAMAVLSGDLEGAAAMKYGRQDSACAIWAALDKARDSIASFLAGDQAYQDSGEAESALPRAPSKFTQSQAEEGPALPSETQYVYDPPQTPVAGYVPGAPDKDGNPQRILAPQDESLDGTVPYGQVLSRYYAQYLDQQEALPQDLLAEIQAYFDSM